MSHNVLTFRLRLSEWLLAAIMTTWGVVLLLPEATFQTNPVYTGLARFAPENAWGLVALALGTLRLFALFVNGNWRRSPHLRSTLAFLSCFVWFQIVIGLLQVRASTGLAVYPWFFILDVYCVYRASSDARESDERARA